MNKKITRRVVLGTVIGGLAAGPFVIRALRQRTSVPESNDMEVRRETYLKLLNEVVPKIEPLNTDRVFKCNFAPKPGHQGTYKILIPFQSADSKEVPETYGLVQGSFRVDMLGESVLFQGGNTSRFVVTPRFLREEPIGKEERWNLLVEQRNLIPVTIQGGQAVRCVSLEIQNLAKPFQALMIDAPENDLKAGMSWDVIDPPDEGFAGVVTRKIDGLYRIDGREVVRVVAEKRSDTKTILSSLEKQLKTLTSKADQQSLRQEMNLIVESGITVESCYDSYYHLESGGLVYRELKPSVMEKGGRTAVSRNVCKMRVDG